MKMTELQFEMIKENLRQLTSKDCFYKEKLKEIDVEAIKTQEDFEKLPFTWRGICEKPIRSDCRRFLMKKWCAFTLPRERQAFR